MKCLGIDPSLTATGLAVVTDAPGPLVASAWHLETSKLRGHERLTTIRAAVMQAARGCDLVTIEGPSYGSAGGQSGHHERAGLWWLLTHALWGAGVPYAVIAPGCRARYATGRGNAGKDEVLLAVARRYPQVLVADNNEADALVLASMGARHLGQPLEGALPVGHLVAMTSAAWPDLLAAPG